MSFEYYEMSVVVTLNDDGTVKSVSVDDVEYLP